jgi:aminoglycoside/choline kinase family phosphotransferase
MSPINQAEALLSSIDHKFVGQALVILMGAANRHVIAGISKRLQARQTLPDTVEHLPRIIYSCNFPDSYISP